MLIAIDGACKRNGQVTCSSTGVAWIQEDNGSMCFLSKFETQSTSQRGELNGLASALQYALDHAAMNEDIIIVTDSEYLYHSVALDWVGKWHANNWIGAQGVTVKNADMWQSIYVMLVKLNTPGERIFVNWTKGHLMSYTPGNVKTAMALDNTGVELFARVTAVAHRPSEYDRIVRDFCRNRTAHEHQNPPPEVCVDWVVANTMADCLAQYIETFMDELNY